MFARSTLPSPSATPPPHPRTEQHDRSRTALHNKGISVAEVERALRRELEAARAECVGLRRDLAHAERRPSLGFHPDAGRELDRLADEAAHWRRRAQAFERERETSPPRIHQHRSRSPDLRRALAVADAQVATLNQQLASAKAETTVAEAKFTALDKRHDHTARTLQTMKRDHLVFKLRSEAEVTLLRHQARAAEAYRHPQGAGFTWAPAAVREFWLASGLAAPAGGHRAGDVPRAVPPRVPSTSSPAVTHADLLAQLTPGPDRPLTPAPQPAVPGLQQWSPSPLCTRSPRGTSLVLGTLPPSRDGSEPSPSPPADRS